METINESTAAEVLAAVQQMEEKFEQLVWYARKAPASCDEYWSKFPEQIRTGALNAAARVEENYPDEVDALKRPELADWTHGYNSGVLASMRFILTAFMANQILNPEDTDEPPIWYGGLEDAIEEFPSLST